MKANVWLIIKDHCRTLYNEDTDRTSFSDVFWFYFFPWIIAVFSVYMQFSPKSEGYNLSVTFFGIFIALLLNIQVAIFSIFQRRWEPMKDTKQAAIQKQKIEIRRKILRELSANISYLIVFGSISLLFFLVVFAIGKETKWTAAVGAMFYIHFLLVFMMVVKRSHFLFQMEYSDNARDITSES